MALKGEVPSVSQPDYYSTELSLPMAGQPGL